MPWIPLPGGGFAHICVRGRKPKRKRCLACSGEQLADLECDGCDAPLCRSCAVTPRKDVDFCPSCTRPLFKEWCATEQGRGYKVARPGIDGRTHRHLRRAAFRRWAVENVARFDPLIGANVPKKKPRCTAKKPCALCASGGGNCRKGE